jgi:aminoglycoside phosphotransferase (APT) family kinase protein
MRASDAHTFSVHARSDSATVANESAIWWFSPRRVQRGPLPALERLLAELQRRRPHQSPTVTLVHGDPKPGNFAFDNDRVSGVCDWEMASVGDPLADIGWAEVNWSTPNAFTSQPGSLSRDDFAALYQELTGIPVRQREWYRAFQSYKMSVIMLVASMLFDRGHTDDVRFAQMGFAVHPCTVQALADLGIDADLDPGPVVPRAERLREVSEQEPSRAEVAAPVQHRSVWERNG